MAPLLLLASFLATLVTGDAFTVTSHNFQVAEDAKIGTVLGRISATSARPETLHFSIKDSATLALASLASPKLQGHTATVDVLLVATLDRDFAPSTRVLHFVVSDGSHEVNRTVLMQISDVNDNSPIFTQSKYAATLDSTAPVGTMVAIVMATDPDQQYGGGVTYSIQTTQESVSQAFTVDSYTGMVQVKSTLIHLAHSIVSFQVVATDGGGLSSAADFTVTVL